MIVEPPGLGSPNAVVEFSGVRRTVNISLIADESLDIGDWVLVHVGFAMAKIDPDEAEQTLGMLREMEAVYGTELENVDTPEVSRTQAALANDSREIS